MVSCKNKRKLLYKRLLPVVVVLFVLFSLSGLFFKFRTSRIDRILETGSYSYLPKEAKNYIKDVYEETGNVILTEKNKEVNVPYLNPEYVEYLTLDDESKESVNLVPDTYVLDYVYTGNSVSDELPSSYDLRNVDGNNYITPLKNQGSLGICWAFAAMEQAESYLMLKNNKPYDSTSELFSTRQLDYASSTNGIKNYTNEFGRRELAAGGNFEIASEIMSYGVSLVDETVMPMNYSLEQKELNEVLNYNNSKYEINRTMAIPRISRTMTYDPAYKNLCTDAEDVDTCYNEVEAEIKQEYMNVIKSNIMKYGGGSVSTTSPDGACAFKNTDGYYVINSNDACYSPLEGHAMHVIGWDDNYSYSYCSTGNTYSNVVNGKCTSGTLVEGNGAFLIRNSWGSSSSYSYVYLTYDSIYNGAYSSAFDFITDLSAVSDKEWDNNYPADIDYNKIYLAKRFSQEITKKTDGDEKLEKIKFMTFIQNGVFSISIVSEGTTYTVDSYETTYPGIYTVDLSDKNIVVSDGFTVTISGTDYYLISQSVSAYTSNVDEVPVISTSDISSDSVEFIVYSDTKNIKDNELISYSLYDGENELVDYLEVSNNVVSINKVNASVKIVKTINSGTYTLKIGYGDYVDSANLVLDVPYSYDGSGTVSDPYLVYSEEDLISIHELDSHYKLANDIVLTDEFVPIGTSDSPFTGGFDGSGHSISGLTISDDTLENSGLFGYVDNSLNTYIKNLVIKNPNISGTGDSGSLIGHLLIDKNETGTMVVDSIYVYGGSISGNNTGSLIGSISGLNFDGNSALINNIFTSSSISGSSSAGVIGSIYEYQGVNLVFSNIQNIGITNTSDSSQYTSYSSSLIGRYLSYYEVSNFMITGFTKSTQGVIFNNLLGAGGTINGKNGYYVKGINDQLDFSNTDNGIYGVSDGSFLVDSNNYSNWDNFDTYWKIETIDGVVRMPVLKGVDFTYTSVNDIKISAGDTVSLSDYLEPDVEFSTITYSVGDDSVVSANVVYDDGNSYPSDVVIEGLKTGKTVINIISNYDGFVGDIEVEVLGNPVVYYYVNDGTDVVKSQTVSSNKAFSLEKNTYERVGYIFGGWGTKESGGTRYADMASLAGINSDLNLYAQWSPIRYTVQYIYSFDGVSNVLNSQSLIYDSPANLMNYTYNEVGYKFVGWGTEADGAVLYEGGQSVVNLTTEMNSTIKLYTVWDPVNYNISFDPNGGSGTMESISTVYGMDVLIPANSFIRNGYKFLGWNTMADGTGTSFAGGQTISSFEVNDGDSIVLYAQWSACDYLIEFNNNGGSGTMSNITAVYDQDIMLPANEFVKDGYKFKEWNTESDGSGTSYSALSTQKSLTYNEKIVLYAIWEPISYTVKFDANGGGGFMDSISAVYDENITLPANVFSRVGYQFKEWNTKSDGSGTSYNELTDQKNLTENTEVILYAVWDPIKYFITFDSNGGTGTMESVTAEFGVNVTIPTSDFVNKGYKFVGWNTVADGTGTSYSGNEVVLNLTTIDGASINLYAQWTESDYVISFNANGGVGNVESISVVYSKEVTLPENNFVREGYEFIEWNTESDGSGISYDPLSVQKQLTENDEIVLYAIWNPFSYVINFDSNGGTGTIKSINTVYDKNVVLPKNSYERYGYNFIAWNTKADGSGTSYNASSSQKNLVMSGEITLYAIWEAISYTIRYDANGGTGSMFNISVDYDENVTISANGFTKEGYRFIEWNTKDDGSGTSYSSSSIYKNLTSEDGKEICLYAIWKPISYTVKFDSNGGTGTIEDISTKYDKNIVLPKNSFERIGYEFIEWNTSGDGNGTSYSPLSEQNNLTSEDGKEIYLYAIWKPISYSISFDSNGGTGTMEDIDTVYDADITISSNGFTKEGYRFIEWNTKADGSGTSYNPLSVYKNLTSEDGKEICLYAIWRPISYTIKFDSNGGTGTMNVQTLVYNQSIELSANSYTNGDLIFVGWNTKSDGTGISYSDNASVKNLTSEHNSEIVLYAIWKRDIQYEINEYAVDDVNSYIDKISVNTSLDDYLKNIVVGPNYSVEVDMNGKEYIYTGSKTKILKGEEVVVEFTNIVRGEVTGDGLVNYLDYVNVYNHIYKTKNPDSNKKLLADVYLLAADMSGEGVINYLDYVKLYNLIKELKGGN